MSTLNPPMSSEDVHTLPVLLLSHIFSFVLESEQSPLLMRMNDCFEKCLTSTANKCESVTESETSIYNYHEGNAKKQKKSPKL